MAEVSLKQRTDCARKTAKGSVFRSKSYAKTVASQYERQSGFPMKVYRCKVCRLWHVATAREFDGNRWRKKAKK